MANVKIAPKNLGSAQMRLQSGLAFARTTVVTDLGGSAVDFSTWNSLSSGSLIGPNPLLEDHSDAVDSLTGNADGTIDIQLNATTLSSPGTYNLSIVGKPLVGDASQYIGVMQVTVAQL